MLSVFAKNVFSFCLEHCPIHYYSHMVSSYVSK